MNDPLLTPREVGARLGVSTATAYRLIQGGLLPVVVLAVRPRRRLLRVRETALETYLRRCEQDAPRLATETDRTTGPRS